MNPTSTIRTETLALIATVVAPGALASAPYLLWLFDDADVARAFLVQHEVAAISLAIMVWVTVGFAIESFGSFIEVYCFDKDRNKEEYENMLREWWLYLRTAWKDEPVGQHYVRRFLVVFKFELNLYVAMLLSLPGVVIVWRTNQLKTETFCGITLLLVFFIVIFHNIAKNSSKVLAELRQQLLKGIGEPPFDQSGSPKSKIEKLLIRKATSAELFS